MDSEKITPAQAALNGAGNFVNQMVPVAATGALNQLLSVNAERRAQERYEKNQALLYKYAQMSQKNAARNQVEGLRAAGLSTALASGAQGMQMTAASMPQTNPSAPAPNPQSALLETSALAQATQAEDNAAAADLKREQERGVRIANDNAEGANYTFNSAYDQVLDNAIKDAEAAGDEQSVEFYKNLRDSMHDIVKTQGDFDALVKVADYYSKSPFVLANRINAMYERDVGARMLSNPRVAASQALRPIWDIKSLKGHYLEAVAMSTKLKSDVNVNEELLPKIKNEVQQIAQAIETDKALQQRIIAEANRTHNSDVQTLVKEGDWYGVAANAVEGGVVWLGETSKGAITAAVGGLTVSGKVGTVKNAAKNASGSGSQSVTKAGNMLKKVRDSANRKVFGTSEAPQTVIMNGKPYTLDKSGNWHPYKARSRKK